MKHEIELEKLKNYFDTVCKKNVRKKLKITEFEGYYIFFKQCLYSGLFSPNYLKNMANLLLNAKIDIYNKKDKQRLEIYYKQLRTMVLFIEDNSRLSIEQIDGVTVKKVYSKVLKESKKR